MLVKKPTVPPSPKQEVTDVNLECPNIGFSLSLVEDLLPTGVPPESDLVLNLEPSPRVKLEDGYNADQDIMVINGFEIANYSKLVEVYNKYGANQLDVTVHIPKYKQG